MRYFFNYSRGSLLILPLSSTTVGWERILEPPLFGRRLSCTETSQCNAVESHGTHDNVGEKIGGFYIAS